MNVAATVAQWSDLNYLVLTSVDRDDLPDGGAGHFAYAVKLIKQVRSDVLVECLVSDFQGDYSAVQSLVQSGLDVYAHNIETVERLQRHVRDRKAGYAQSLKVLQNVKQIDPKVYTKSSIMLGLGETDEEVLQTMVDLREVGCDVLTLGQYMRPSLDHLEVVKYVTPEKFQYWEKEGLRLGFRYVASGPLVRSSFKAGEYFMNNMIRTDHAAHNEEQV